MKTVLVGISSRFIHSVLACYCLKEYCPDSDIEVLELNVNMPYGEIKDTVLNIKADFVGFSCYIFNIALIKRLLTDLKNEGFIPKIILGGPEAGYEFDELLPLCDYIVVGEGEEAFKKIISGNAEEKVVAGTRPPLESLPSPYNDYFIDKIVTKSGNNKIIYFESSRGCPYKCSYCMSSLSGGVRFFPLERTKKELAFLYSRHPKQIKFVDRTFNTDLSRAKEIIKFIIEMTAGDTATNFHFEMSAEIVDDELIEIMSAAPAGLIQIEIGVQSFNESTLRSCDRAFDTRKLKENLKKFMTLKNIHIHLDLIAGLPDEGYDSFRESVNEIFAYSPDYLQIGFLKLLKGSKMRADADKYKMVYKTEPPYEIISSIFITEEELNEIRTVAAAVGAFYNKHRYDEILQNLQKSYESKYDMYYKIGTVLASGKYRKNVLEDMYKLLLDLT